MDMDLTLINITIVTCGLITGSFINVISYRIPKNLPIVFSRSMCPKCNYSIPLYRNIPIITYLLQIGKCYNCNKRISIQYLIIEIITPIIFLLGIKNNSGCEYYLFLWMSSILIIISLIDYKTFTIPLSLMLYMLLGQLVFIILDIDLYQIKNMLLGLFLGLTYLGLTFIITSMIYKKQTLGYGDLLLISIIGLWLGPINILICIFLSAIIGLLIWFINYFRNIKEEKIPFGTCLAFSSILLKIINLDFISYMTKL